MAGRNTPIKQAIAGVVLAGGKSSRMGRDKAILPFHGRPLIDHMIGLLRAAGCEDVFVSGQRNGYACIPDRTPEQGPAAAMRHVLQELSAYKGVLFVPVDMPLLTPHFLRRLLVQKKGAFFDGCPLPAYIMTTHVPSVCTAVHELLDETETRPITRPKDAEKFLINVNTPEEWRMAVEA